MLDSKHKSNSFQTVRGHLTGFRVMPGHLNNKGAICLDNEWIVLDFISLLNLGDKNKKVDADDARNRRVLEQGSNANTEAVADIHQRPDGRYELRWLLSTSGNLLPPSRKQIRWRGAKFFALWFVIGLAATLLLIWGASGTFGSQDINWYQLAGTLIGLFLAPVLLWAAFDNLYRAIRSTLGRTEKSSEQALHNAQATLASSGFSDIIATPVTDIQRTEPACKPGDAIEATEVNGANASPHLHLLRAKVRNIEVTRAQASMTGVVPQAEGGAVVMRNVLKFNCFTFDLAEHSCTLFASRDYGGGEVFLAENDDVEVVVADADLRSDTSQPRLVWALHNHMDGITYASHRIMVQSANKRVKPLVGKARMTAITASYWRVMRWYFLVGWLIVGLLLAAGEIFLDFNKDPIVMVSCFLALFVFYGLVTEFPRYLLYLKWRRGHPSKRQRLADRVYALLGADSALKPSIKVFDT